jgi:hypothetical protein
VAQKESSSAAILGQEAAGAAQSSGAEASPADGFRAFLVGLATDPAKLGAFIKDADTAMEAAGISSADQSILKSGNPAVIHSRLGRPTSSTPRPPVTVLVVDMVSTSGDKSDAAAEPFVRTADAIPLVMAQGLASPWQAFPPAMSQAPSSPSQAVPLIFRQTLSAPSPDIPLVFSHAFSSPTGPIPLWQTQAVYAAVPPQFVHPQTAYLQFHSPAYPPAHPPSYPQFYPSFYPHPYQQFYPQFLPLFVPPTSTEKR